MASRRLRGSLIAAAVTSTAALCLAPASASAAPAIGDYTCTTFSLGPTWVDSTGGTVSMSGSGDCVAGGVRYSNTGLNLSGPLTVSCGGSSGVAINGTLTLNDGVHGPLTTSAAVSLGGTSSGANGPITLGSGQQGQVVGIMTKFILSPGDFCSDRTEPVNLTLRGGFASTSPGTL